MTIFRIIVTAALVLLIAVQTGCTKVTLPKVKMPKVSMPKLPSIGADDDTNITPRDLLTAKLVNPRADPDTPNMTVGKMIEFADRYLACDCANLRFVRSWRKTAEGYRLYTNSEAVRPIEFVCAELEQGRHCYLLEIDRGSQSKSIEDRFVPGSEFIQFLYDNGVRCERETPCP